MRGGDTDAYGALVRAYMRKAYAVAYRILRHQQDAEDTVQDAFFTALERIDRFESGRPFAPWLFRIVANQAHNRRDANAVRRAEPLDDDVAPASYGTAADDPQRAAEGSELRDRFREALAGLAPRPRLVVQLSDVDGFAPSEIATMLDLSPGTVRAYLHEARHRLRDALAVFHGDGT